jgi:glycosyltransferase involved in cell wall biosynthesis
MTRRLKVAHIVTLLELGGAQQNTLYTLQSLDASRFEPVLLCGRGALLDKDVQDAPYPKYFINSLVRQVHPLRDLIALCEIFFVLKRVKPDIVHTHSSKAGILGRWAAKLAGVPVIIHSFHGFGFNREQKWWTRFGFVAAERATAKISRALIAVSRSNQSEALALGIGRPEQYRLIRSGIDVGLFQSMVRRPNAPDGIAVSAGQKLVTTIGPYKPQKNLGDFVQAAAAVHAKFPGARFLMVGDGALRGALEAQVARLGLSEVFLMPGWRRDIPHILMRTDIFVLTSLWEGLPRALVEAMAAGLPCVANAIDGVQDVVTDGVTGFMVPPKRPDLTAERISFLLQNPKFALQMGENARQAIGREFDIDDMVRAQETLYEEVRPASR